MAKEFFKEGYVLNNTYKIPTRKSFTDLSGHRYKKVEVVGWAGINAYREQKSPTNQWWCKCSCGNSKYFLVANTSLKKNLTSSCGCNYKNNGGTVSESLSVAESKLLVNYNLLEYTNRRKPCKVKCSVCQDQAVFDTFYSAQQRGVWCSCKDIDEIAKRIVSSVNYTLTRRLPDNNIEASCNSCSALKVSKCNTANWVDTCPCRYDVDVENNSNPSCVYFNIDENNPSLFKIGKANEPYARLNQVMTSVKKNGYDHKFKVKHVKWFANEKVAFQVESMYHRWFKEKALYGFKNTTEGNSVFDGSNEVFVVSKEDVEEFNKIYKATIDKFEKEKPEFVFTKEVNDRYHIEKPKGRLGVRVWFPNTKSLYSYMKLKRSDWKDDIIDSSDNLITAWKVIKAKEKELLFEVDGEYYDSMVEFYEQHKHFAGVELRTFRDRICNKKWEIWKALTEIRSRQLNNIFYDLDGKEVSCSYLYNKYKPLVGFNTFKDKLIKGDDLKVLVEYVPTINITKVALYKGKYYSFQKLYKVLSCSIARSTFYKRVESDWCPLIASLVPKENKYPYKTLKTSLHIHYPEIPEKLKQG